MSTETPPPKRRRIDDEDRAEKEITRSKFWFEDGNVVLQAESTQFRVHRTMLSRHSDIFRDMFSVPQPPEPLEPCVEGCPIVALADKAEDFEHVLSIFYDNIRTNDMRKLMDFPQVAAILRLGKKYEIEYLRDEGLKRLRLEYPKTLELWDESYDDYVSIKNGFHQPVINLAHELSIRSILPAVYTGMVMSYDSEEILAGGEENIHLNQEALNNCLIGRDKILIAIQETLKDWVGRSDIIPGPGCASAVSCTSNRLKTILTLDMFSPTDHTKIAIFHRDPFKDDFTYEICFACQESVESVHTAVREKMWESLPFYFGLPRWEDLKDFDA